MNDELIKEAKIMLDLLGVKSQGLMGLNHEEEAQFEILLWLFGGGEKPEIE